MLPKGVPSPRTASTRPTTTDPSDVPRRWSGAMVPTVVAHPAMAKSPRRRTRLLVNDHAALDLTRHHRVEGAVQLVQAHPTRDHLVELVLAVHVEVDQHRHVGPLAAAAEGRAGQHALL